MIAKNKQVLLLVVLLLPFLSGCGLSSVLQNSSSDQAKQSEVSVGDLTKTNTVVKITDDQTKIKSDLKSISNTTTAKKIINNLNKNNAMDKFDPNKQYTAAVHTSLGDFVINFNKGQTPKTVENFVTLAKKGFYDKTIFHRVIKGFMIQGGDPIGDGTGGPGYKFADEKFDGEYVRGAVAMANSGPNTNGSQFFVMHEDYPLPKNYTIFGKVVSGMETVDKIAESKVESGGFGENSKPVVPTVINSIEMSEK